MTNAIDYSLDSIIAKERETFTNLSVREKLQVQEYFQLTERCTSEKLTGADLHRVLELTAFMQNHDLSPLCMEGNVFDVDNVEYFS